ncbi:desmethyl-deoxy-podophyllotoxin synthase-like [Lolium rigidum]|uniref:desmethyl-deoxy-podophyllotoxin synthase-like n=1 Tax=Lolium rigidum TaxID=89674 RepID=UPI001F5DA3BB|nr:desmethyl-deoxy-podophyllotoxin synthase-like [Lolium rigidum]
MAHQDQAALYYYICNYPVLLATILLLVPLLLLVKLRPGNHRRGKNPPPGPWQLPVIGSLHSLVGALPHYRMRELARRHGPLMLLRLGEIHVVVASSASAAREILKTHDAVFATRPRTSTTSASISHGVGIVLAPMGEHLRQVRKLCVNELLSTRKVQSFHKIREEEARKLVASLASQSLQPEAVNVSSRLVAYFNNTVARAVLGDEITDRDAFIECLDEGIRVAAVLSLSDLFPSSRLARAFCGTTRRLEAASRRMRHVTNGIIEEHRARRAVVGAGNGDENILDVLLRIQTEDATLHMGTIRAMITDLFVAGSETPATMLNWAMAEMMRNPKVLGRAQAEVRATLAGQSHVPEKALPELRYLQLVIKETLRLHMPGPLLMPRECQEPCRVLGYDVPKGAMVLVNAWAIARDNQNWGSDAEEFCPERFQEPAQAAHVDFRGQHFQFLPFGAGRRICPGMNFSLPAMELALASLLFHFDWELPKGTLPAQLDMAEVFGMTAKRKTDLLLHAYLRVPLPASS